MKLLIIMSLFSILKNFNSPMINDRDTLTEAFVNNPSRRDYQTNGPTPIRLWAVKEINGVYANMMYQFSGGTMQQTNFFDFSTFTWIGDTSGYDTTTFEKGGNGNMVVNYSIYNYQYYFFVAYNSYETGEIGIAWPDTNFVPTNPYVNYIIGSHPGVYPLIGITSNGYLHLIFSNINYEILYDRSVDLVSWTGSMPISPTQDAPWYGFYADPFSNTLVLTYCRTSSDYHIIMLVDTMSGDMFYAGAPLQVDVSQEIYNQTGTPCYIGFVGDGNPFVDRDGNIHLITFGSDGSNVAPVEIYHFFWDLKADTFGIHFIKQLTDLYYPIGVNTLVAGRSQIGQVRERGTLYAIWEEFIQEPGRFVVSSTDDTLAPTRIILAQSFDNGINWSLDTLLESDQIRDNNDWLRFPVVSPVIPEIGSAVVVYWGVYDDDDPGFFWQGQGNVSRVSMFVGTKEYLYIGEKPGLINSGFDFKLIAKDAKILLQVPYKAHVSINLFDITGKRIKRIFEGIKDLGTYKIDLNFKIPSGSYFIQAKAGNKKKVIKWIRVK